MRLRVGVRVRVSEPWQKRVKPIAGSSITWLYLVMVRARVRVRVRARARARASVRVRGRGRGRGGVRGRGRVSGQTWIIRVRIRVRVRGRGRGRGRILGAHCCDEALELGLVERAVAILVKVLHRLEHLRAVRIDPELFERHVHLAPLEGAAAILVEP